MQHEACIKGAMRRFWITYLFAVVCTVAAPAQQQSPAAPSLDSETGEVNNIPNSPPPGAPGLDFETGEVNNIPNTPGAPVSILRPGRSTTCRIRPRRLASRRD